MIHEAFLFDKEVEGHGNMKSLINMAKNNNVKCLAFTHIDRVTRRNDLIKIKKEISKEDIKIIIPEPLEEYTF